MATTANDVVKSWAEFYERYYAHQAKKITEILNQQLFAPPPALKCECGAESCGHPGHSRWCPKAEK
jgi:hypothetical protein